MLAGAQQPEPGKKMQKRRALQTVRSERGQAATELALILPIVVFLIFGALEVGRVFTAWIIVTQAAREGARVASVSCTLDPGCATAVDGRVTTSLTGLNAATARTTLSPGPYVAGDPVDVRIEYDVALVTPLVSALFPANPITVTGETTMRLE